MSTPAISMAGARSRDSFTYDPVDPKRGGFPSTIVLSNTCATFPFPSPSWPSTRKVLAKLCNFAGVTPHQLRAASLDSTDRAVSVVIGIGRMIEQFDLSITTEAVLGELAPHSLPITISELRIPIAVRQSAV